MGMGKGMIITSVVMFPPATANCIFGVEMHFLVMMVNKVGCQVSLSGMHKNICGSVKAMVEATTIIMVIQTAVRKFTSGEMRR